MKNNFTEVFVALVFVLLAILILNPLSFWMPDMMLMGMLIGSLVLFGVYASFVLREKAADERDVVHKSIAGRNAFLVGAAFLTIGILVQGYTHEVDAWLVLTLTAMVVTKMISRFWSDRNL